MFFKVFSVLLLSSFQGSKSLCIVRRGKSQRNFRITVDNLVQEEKKWGGQILEKS